MVTKYKTTPKEKMIINLMEEVISILSTCEDLSDPEFSMYEIMKDAVDKEKKDEKDGLISIDESRDNQSEIQKITDKYIALIETKLTEKEKEILKV